MSCSLSSDELLPLIRDSASALRYQHAEARAKEGYILQFLLGRNVFVALPTGYGIACATSFYRWYLTESGM